jgi:hypothetical protein
MLCDGRAAGERAVVRVLSFELSTDTANFDSGALGFNEECKSRLIAKQMDIRSCTGTGSECQASSRKTADDMVLSTFSLSVLIITRVYSRETHPCFAFVHCSICLGLHKLVSLPESGSTQAKLRREVP